MKIKLILFFLCFSLLNFAQSRIFANAINETNLAEDQKINNNLASTYLLTKYYAQSSFHLKSDLEIVLPSGRIIKADFLKSYHYSNKSESSVYAIENEAKSELVLSQSGNIITGMYASQSGEKVIFHQLNNQLFAVSTVSEAAIISKDSQTDFIKNENSASQKVNANICLETTAICPSTIIDVMVLFTTDAKNSWGGTAQSNAFVATAITNFNTALQNSGVQNVFINLVYSGEIQYTESGSLSTDLPRFRNNNDGYMDDVHTLRSLYGADLCALVTSTPNNTCGLGYLNINPSNYNASAAFSATVFSCVVSNYSMAHEMGHNMGLNHDWYVEQSAEPCSQHHGYTNQTAIALGTSSVNSQRWRTIMAYNNECSDSGFNCTRINRWANPDINFNSEPTGVAIGNMNPSNEAFGFMRFACVVAQFMPTSNLGNFEIKTNEIRDFTVFPNPAKDEINIWIKNDERYHFKIVNVLGQIVLSSDKKTINVKGLASGEYFLNVYTEKNSLVGSRKFIKK